jgi:CRP-like cAMP-binding protein
VLISGVAQRQKDTNDGRRQIVGFCFPGDPLDFEQACLREADCSVQMTTAGAVARVSLHELRGLLGERPGLARAVVAAMLADAASFREWILNVGRRDARQRIAHLLCEIALRSHVEGERDIQLAFPFTQEQIADATGITTVHVNRTLRQLTLDNLIARDGGTMTIPDLKALRQAAGFDARYLHLRNGD